MVTRHRPSLGQRRHLHLVRRQVHLARLIVKNHVGRQTGELVHAARIRLGGHHAIGAKRRILNPLTLSLVNIGSVGVVGIGARQPVPLGQLHVNASLAPVTRSIGRQSIPAVKHRNLEVTNAVIVLVEPHDATNGSNRVRTLAEARVHAQLIVAASSHIRVSSTVVVSGLKHMLGSHGIILAKHVCQNHLPVERAIGVAIISVPLNRVRIG